MVSRSPGVLYRLVEHDGPISRDLRGCGCDHRLRGGRPLLSGVGSLYGAAAPGSSGEEVGEVIGVVLAPDIMGYYERYLFKRPGQHVAVIGPTGAGKTNTLYFFVAMLRTLSPKERIVWFDPGKSAELAGLALFAPLVIHIPKGCSIEIKEVITNKYQLYPFDVVEFAGWRSLWSNIDRVPPEKISVVCFEPFVTGGQVYARAVSGIFGELIELVKEYKIAGPMAIFIDELQGIAPSKVNELNPGHYIAGAKIQFNIERLRSEGIRIVGAAQGWSRLRYGVRASFQWIAIKQGARFTRDEAGLSRFNNAWANLHEDQCVIADRNRKWRGVLKLPFYGDGRDLWHVRYYGKLKTKDSKERAHVDEGLDVEEMIRS
jgi:hypothetical protein